MVPRKFYEETILGIFGKGIEVIILL